MYMYRISRSLLCSPCMCTESRDHLFSPCMCTYGVVLVHVHVQNLDHSFVVHVCVQNLEITFLVHVCVRNKKNHQIFECVVHVCVRKNQIFGVCSPRICTEMWIPIFEEISYFEIACIEFCVLWLCVCV